MTGPDATDKLVAFGGALEEAMRESGIRATAVATATSVTADAVRKWMAGQREPEPQTVFVIEEELRLAPGELSRHLGYVPVTADISLLAAIDAAADLSDRDRKLLRQTYRTLRSSEPET